MPSLQERQVLWQKKEEKKERKRQNIWLKEKEEVNHRGEGMEAISQDASEVHKTIQKAT